MMFPAHECTHVSDNVFVHKPKEGPHQAWMRVDSQYFRVGVPCDDARDALFLARQLEKALDKLRGQP
jgi:hypothetical protein